MLLNLLKQCSARSSCPAPSIGVGAFVALAFGVSLSLQPKISLLDNLTTKKAFTWLFVRFGRVFAFSPCRKEAKWFFSFIAFTCKGKRFIFKAEKCLYRSFLAAVERTMPSVWKREKSCVAAHGQDLDLWSDTAPKTSSDLDGLQLETYCKTAL